MSAEPGIREFSIAMAALGAALLLYCFFQLIDESELGPLFVILGGLLIAVGCTNLGKTSRNR